MAYIIITKDLQMYAIAMVFFFTWFTSLKQKSIKVFMGNS